MSCLSSQQKKRFKKLKKYVLKYVQDSVCSLTKPASREYTLQEPNWLWFYQVSMYLKEGKYTNLVFPSPWRGETEMSISVSLKA